MSHQNDLDDQAFARAAAQMLRQSEAIDSRTAARLATARQQALAAADAPSWGRLALIPAAALGAAALVAVTVHPLQHQVEPAQTAGIDTLDLLTDDMSPTFYRDLEFYRWLEKEHPHA